MKLQNLNALLSHHLSPGFLNYLNNTGWLFFEKGLRTVLTLIVAIWVSRYLGPEEFGILSYAISVVSLLGSLNMVCIDDVVVRELVRSKLESQQAKILGTAFRMKVLGVLLMWVLVALILILIDDDSRTEMLMLIIAISLVFRAFNIIYLAFQAKVQLRTMVFAQLIQVSVTAAATILLILFDMSLVWFALVHILDGFVLFLGMIVVFPKVAPRASLLAWDTGLAKTIIRDAMPLFFAAIVTSLYTRMDQVMINAFMDASSVGIYAVASKLSLVWAFVPMLICTSIFPAIISAKEREAALYQTRLQQLFDFLVWLALPLVILISLSSDSIVMLLYGSEYQPAGSVLKIHILGAVFVFTNLAIQKQLVLEGLQRYTFYSMAMGCVINAILNYVLILNFGIEGAAWATFIAYSVSGYLAYGLFKQTRHAFSEVNRSMNLIGVIARFQSR